MTRGYGESRESKEFQGGLDMDATFIAWTAGTILSLIGQTTHPKQQNCFQAFQDKI